YAFNRCIHVLCGCLSAYVPRNDVWFLSEATRAFMADRYGNFLRADEFGLYRLYSAVGTNVLLGCSSYCEYVWCDTLHWGNIVKLDTRGFHALRCCIESFFCIPC